MAFLPEKVSELTKDIWKEAREKAGFQATLFGGPSVGSKIDAVQKALAKARPRGENVDFLKINAVIKAYAALAKALDDYAKKADKAVKKNTSAADFAEECRSLADKVDKKIPKWEAEHERLTQLADTVTGGKVTAQREAVKNLFDQF